MFRLTLLLLFSTAFAHLDCEIEQAMHKFQVPGIAIGVVHKGEVTFLKGFGYRNLEKQLPATPDTLFAIGSCTKAFTAHIAALLVDIDEPILQSIPEFRVPDPFATTHMTMRDVLSHQTGMAAHNLIWYNLPLTIGDILNRLPHLEPIYGLRQKFHYNNTMFAVAGEVLRRSTGHSWEILLHKHIFGPLGMRRTNVSVDQMQCDANHATPYFQREGKIISVPFADITHIGPAGSINSSVREMIAWMELQLKNPMPVTQRKQIEIAPGEGYGLGWFLEEYHGHCMVNHAGSIDGFRSNLVLIPQEELGVVVLSNSSAGSQLAVPYISRLLLDHFLGLDPSGPEEESWEEVSLPRFENATPPLPLHKYVGNYVDSGYGTMQIFEREQRLYMRYNGVVFPLAYTPMGCFVFAPDAWHIGIQPLMFTFGTDEEERLVELCVPLQKGVAPIRFSR